MNYTILFLTHERVVRSVSWDEGLGAAMKYARNQVGTEEAHRVEIWDELDRIIFRWSSSGPPTITFPTMRIH